MSSVRRAIGTAAILAGFSVFGPVSVAFALELPAVADQDCEGFQFDGIACETRLSQFPDKDCADFPSQAAAQAELKKNPRDPYKLDGDHDGYACESRFGKPARAEQVKVKPVGGVATGGGEPDEPNGGLLEIGAVALAGTVLLTATATGASLLLRRRVER
ncbi:excalibur calcium-binding domain-containing protein [Amycolatopsis alba]|uniref:Excalibur calcium-binding protein n=1 Tax=Amycolatopsis alba DSM 44262 TaxID=1125972 RepID=A0A229RNT0_AMYAL|nr:excalibur calcium-binding domain-containing protein [Amycolatopsis alba]OXM48064.1 excalibur calcium-binding protein [Amycolatopsis alba DSM 44262]